MTSETAERKDLVVLVADHDCKEIFKTLLEKRLPSLHITKPTYTVFPHPEKDPGCRKKGHVFLRNFLRQYNHALLVFDREGCGRDILSAMELENECEDLLSKNGWESRAAAIVIEPELEAWIWSDSPHVASAMNWNDYTNLKEWLSDKGFFTGQEESKPGRPKEAFQTALRKTHTPRSSAIFKKIAGHVSLSRCTDRAFEKLKQKLVGWFGQQ